MGSLLQMYVCVLLYMAKWRPENVFAWPVGCIAAAKSTWQNTRLQFKWMGNSYNKTITKEHTNLKNTKTNTNTHQIIEQAHWYQSWSTPYCDRIYCILNIHILFVVFSWYLRGAPRTIFWSILKKKNWVRPPPPLLGPNSQLLPKICFASFPKLTTGRCYGI